MKAVINESDTADFLASFEQAISSEAIKCVELLGQRAEAQMRDFEERAGHHALSQLWTHDSAETATGAICEVWSAAEQVTFFNRTTSATGGRIKSSKYPVEGEALLAILEGGARQHPIKPRDPRGILTIPLRGTEERGTMRRYKGGFDPNVGPQAPADGDTEFRKEVQHPGVVGNGNLATVADLVEQAAQTYADAAADDIGGSL
jgi:hypothetical protein